MKSALLGIILSIASLFGYHESTQTQSLGSTFTPVQGTQFFLAGAGITSTSNTVQLTSFQTPDGRNLVMTMFGDRGYGALEPGTSKLEDITFTGIVQNANGSATLTGVTRGNDFISPYAASTTLAKSHSGGATFILSNTAGFYGNQFLFSNNTGTSTAFVVTSSTSPWRYDSVAAQAGGTYIATTSEFASIAYVNAVSFAGVANATEGVKGISQFATALQNASSTILGSTAAGLVMQSRYATDTPQSGCASGFSTAGAGCTPIATLLGKIRQSWLDLTENWAFTGAVSIAASSAKTLTLDGLAYIFPTAQPSASSTILMNNGSGTLSWNQVANTLLVSTTTTAAMTSATTSWSGTYTTLRAEISIPSTRGGSASTLGVIFNGDYVSNYTSQNNFATSSTFAFGKSFGGAAGAGGISGGVLLDGDATTGTTSPAYFTLDIRNDTSVAKRVISQGSLGQATAIPATVWGSGVWNNTSAAITGITFNLILGAGAGTFPVGTIIKVYGTP